jgi:hypothetical protein
MTKTTGPMVSEGKRIREVNASTTDPGDDIVSTRDHELIRRWAKERGAEPATGEVSRSGPATRAVNDGGAGVRFNFPGAGMYRPIEWDEWFENFDGNNLVFVYEIDTEPGPPSNRYRIIPGDGREEDRGFLRQLLDRLSGR